MLRCFAVGGRRVRTARLRQSARDFLIGLTIFLAALAFATLDASEADASPAVATLAKSMSGAEDPSFFVVPVQHVRQVATVPAPLPGPRAAAEEGPLPAPHTKPVQRVAAIGIMGLFFAAMSMITLGLWRQLGRAHAFPRRTRRGS